MRPPICALLVVLAVIGWSVGVGPKAAATDDSRLADLLARMARVARLYRDVALKFECTETIEYKAREDWDPPSGYVKFSYVYERDTEGRLEDCRLWRKSVTNGRTVRCVEPDDYRIPLYLRNAYLFIFAFLEDRQPWHEYRIVGEESVSGRPAIVVDYGPGNVVRANFNDWYGRAWIDRDGYQLLKVLAYRPNSWAAKQQFEKARAASPGGKPDTKEYELEWVVTEFGREMNGMRFVSEVQLHRARYRWVADFREEKLLDVRQTYRRYRFYHVASREEIEGLVEGRTPASSPR
ncbi:MAG: hypothetical protein LAO51_17780 [Acidobacteriia bacterium]|nr:hypothetical protein [Terriglobia bacterium]